MISPMPVAVPDPAITREQAVNELRSVFDQIIATGGVKSMQHAINLCSLFNTISGYIGDTSTLDK